MYIHMCASLGLSRILWASLCVSVLSAALWASLGLSGPLHVNKTRQYVTERGPERPKEAHKNH